MRRLKLKVCGMRDAGNISAVGALLPDFMGFIFVPSSPRFVGDSLPVAVSLPSSVKRIGVFQNASISEILSIRSQMPLDGVQLHGDESGAYMATLKETCPDLFIMKAIKVHDRTAIANLAKRSDLPDLYLFDNATGGSGEAFAWSWLRAYTGDTPFMLAGGVGVATIDTVISLARELPTLVGIDINSRVEISPGMKDVTQISAIMTRLEV